MTIRNSKAKSLAAITAVYLFAGIAGILLVWFLTFDYWLNLLSADVD